MGQWREERLWDFEARTVYISVLLPVNNLRLPQWLKPTRSVPPSLELGWACSPGFHEAAVRVSAGLWSHGRLCCRGIDFLWQDGAPLGHRSEGGISLLALVLRLP